MSTEETSVYISDGFFASIDNKGNIIKNGWSADKSRPYHKYYSDSTGKNLANTWAKIDNKWYYFNSDREIVTDIQTIEGKKQLFSKDGIWIGQLNYKSGWNLVGGHYYYVENSKLATGWKKLSGKWYYFNDDGCMLKSCVQLIDKKFYCFSKDGSMITSAWCNLESTNFCEKAGVGGSLLTGWQKIGSSWYYFDSYGKLMTDCFILDDKIQVTSSQGVFIKSVKINDADGWFKFSEPSCKYYKYFKKGTDTKGWKLIGNKYYYFDNDGRMYHDNIAFEYGKCYYLNPDGSCATSTGWVGNGKYYVQKGVLLKGWQKINGKWYYLDQFSYSKYNSCITKIDGTYYRFDKNGVEISVFKPKAGWQQVDGNWYYCKDGQLINSGYFEIDSYFYCFDQKGRMLTNYIDDDIIYGNNGMLLKNQWIKINDRWYYVDALGKMYKDEIRVIDGKIYVFDENGKML